MSFRADMRSAKVSSSRTLSSSSVEISDSEGEKCQLGYTVLSLRIMHTGVCVVLVIRRADLLGLEGLVLDLY